MLLALLPSAAHGDPSSLEQAEKFYQAGEWEKAHQLYKAELAGPGEKPPSFFFNYGTVAAKAGFAGEGYVALMKACFLAPFDADTRFNLSMVAAQTPAASLQVRPATWFSWWPRFLHMVSWRAWALVALLSSALVIALLRSRAQGLGFALLPVSALLYLAVLLGWLQDSASLCGVISPSVVKSGPGASFSEITTLEPGALVNREELREGWIKVRFHKQDANDDTVGWVEPSTVIDVR